MDKKIQIFILLGIILISGILGGIGNFYILCSEFKEMNTEIYFNNFILQKSIVLGVIAASVIPLFLNIISSNLLEIKEESKNYKNYFIFGGLCLVASLFSNRFLTNAYNNVFNQFNEKFDKVEELAFEAKKNADVALKTEIVNQKLENSSFEEIYNTSQLKLGNDSKKYNLNLQDQEILNKIFENKIIYKNDLVLDSFYSISSIEKLTDLGIIYELKVQDELVLSVNDDLLKK